MTPDQAWAKRMLIWLKEARQRHPDDVELQALYVRRMVAEAQSRQSREDASYWLTREKRRPRSTSGANCGIGNGCWTCRRTGW